MFAVLTFCSSQPLHKYPRHRRGIPLLLHPRQNTASFCHALETILTFSWKMGVDLFSTLSSLQQPPNFDKV